MIGVKRAAQRSGWFCKRHARPRIGQIFSTSTCFESEQCSTFLERFRTRFVTIFPSPGRQDERRFQQEVGHPVLHAPVASQMFCPPLVDFSNTCRRSRISPNVLTVFFLSLMNSSTLAHTSEAPQTFCPPLVDFPNTYRRFWRSPNVLTLFFLSSMNFPTLVCTPEAPQMFWLCFTPRSPTLAPTHKAFQRFQLPFVLQHRTSLPNIFVLFSSHRWIFPWMFTRL